MTVAASVNARGVEHLDVMEEAVNYNAWLLSLVQNALDGARSVLDFGAGQGQFAIPLNKCGWSVTCIEPDADCRTALQQVGMACFSDLAAVKDAAFDAVYTLNVLEHIQDDDRALREIRRCLKPGGRLFVYVPAFMCLYTAADRRVGHVRRYRRSELARRLSEAGFAVETARYADSLGFFATLLYKAIGSRDGSINRTMLVAYDRAAFPVSRVLDNACGMFFGKNVIAHARRAN